MGRALWSSGYTIYIEAAFSAAVDDYGVWDTSEWDAATFGPDIIWSDVTADLFAFNTKLGRNRENGHHTAATGAFTLKNQLANYTPENLSGDYVTGGVTGIRPGRPVRGYVRSSGGTVYPLFYGRIDDFDEAIMSLAPVTTFIWYDGIADLAARDGYEQSPVGSGETVGARLHRVLDNAEWDQDRNIDVGTTTLQATTLAQAAWTELLLSADSDGGTVWVDPDGSFVFADNEALLRNTRSNTSQATFTDEDTAGALHYESIELSNGKDLLINEAALARAGGTAQIASDLTSRALYGLNRFSRSDLVCETDAQVNALAEQMVSRRKDPERRPRSMVLNPRVYPALWPYVLGARIQDRITVTRHHVSGVEITHDCFIDGIEHDSSDGKWLTTFRLAATNGIPSATEFGVWNTSNWDEAYWGIAA